MSSGSNPSSAPIASAGARASPVSITMRSPSARSASSASRAPGLDRIGDRDHAGEPCRRRRHTRGSAAGRAGRSVGRTAADRSMPLLGHQRAAAEQHVGRADARPHTLPGDRLEAGRRTARQTARAFAAATTAAASGCSLPCSTAAAMRQKLLFWQPCRMDRDDLGTPFSQRSGLVDHDRVHSSPGAPAPRRASPARPPRRRARCRP